MIQEFAGKILENIFDVLVIVDQDLTILDLSDSVADLGYTKAELTGKSILDLVIDNRGFREAIPMLAKLANEGKREVRRFEALRRDGSHLWICLLYTSR